MMKIRWKKVILVFLVTAASIFILVEYGSAKNPEYESVNISGPGDLYYLSVAINQQAEQVFDLPSLKMHISPDGINDLKNGKSDAVLVGREPTEEENKGLVKYVIAFDAVCIILDENSYTGGTAFAAGRPFRKNTGLREITREALQEIFSESVWRWTEGYYEAKKEVVSESLSTENEAEWWIPKARPLAPAFYFPPGKFDTQTVLYQNIGLNEIKLVTRKAAAYTQSRFNKEEEVLSFEFTGSNYGQSSGIQDFAFKLAFASRRTMTVAPRFIPVKVLQIDGVDPLVDTEAIYNGSYLLNRKIHLLTRQNPSTEVKQLVSYLLSSEGQQFIARIGYLPISDQLQVKNLK